ncbi:hypothetical protein PSPO01_16466 [Paraphaeosphaeria sporulosa]
MTSPNRHPAHDLYTRDPYGQSECKQQSKVALTELLNIESVRSDEKCRESVQERLMDNEQLIRKERRRHSLKDRKVAASIAKHLSIANLASADDSSNVGRPRVLIVWLFPTNHNLGGRLF